MGGRYHQKYNVCGIKVNREDWLNTLCNDLISCREMIHSDLKRIIPY